MPDAGRSANLNCAALANTKRFLDCGSLRLSLCNSDEPDEISVRPETRGRDSDGIRGRASTRGSSSLTRRLPCLATLPTLSAAGNARAA